MNQNTDNNSEQEKMEQSNQLQQEYLALANPGVMNHQLLTIQGQIMQLIQDQNKILERQATAWEKIANSGS